MHLSHEIRRRTPQRSPSTGSRATRSHDNPVRGSEKGIRQRIRRPSPQDSRTAARGSRRRQRPYPAHERRPRVRHRPGGRRTCGPLHAALPAGPTHMRWRRPALRCPRVALLPPRGWCRPGVAGDRLVQSMRRRRRCSRAWATARRRMLRARSPSSSRLDSRSGGVCCRGGRGCCLRKVWLIFGFRPGLSILYAAMLVSNSPI